MGDSRRLVKWDARLSSAGFIQLYMISVLMECSYVIIWVARSYTQSLDCRLHAEEPNEINNSEQKVLSGGLGYWPNVCVLSPNNIVIAA